MTAGSAANDVSLHNSLISVVVATRNAADTIARCMDSIIGQDYENWEIVVSDGNSTDGTIEQVKEYAASHCITWQSSPDTAAKRGILGFHIALAPMRAARVVVGAELESSSRAHPAVVVRRCVEVYPCKLNGSSDRDLWCFHIQSRLIVPILVPSKFQTTSLQVTLSC